MNITLIIVIAWLFVSGTAALTYPSVIGGIISFVFSGLLPCGIIIYLAGSKIRRQRRRYQEMMAQRNREKGSEEKGSE